MENKENVAKTPDGETKTVWALVANAAVDYMDAVSNDTGMTKEEIVQGVIDSGKCTLIPQDKIEELVDAVLVMFVGNGLLINNQGVYIKRVLQDTPAGKMMAERGIVIERAKKNET